MLSERLVAEGTWYKALVDTSELIFTNPNTTLEGKNLLIYCSLLLGDNKSN